MSQPQPNMPNKPPVSPITPITPSPPVKPSPPKPQLDQYGCYASAGYYWSPSENSCCKCDAGHPPQPWVCNPSELPTTGSMTWHGCKEPSQKWDAMHNTCHDCQCMPPGKPQ
jgi:hypothetical protein